MESYVEEYLEKNKINFTLHEHPAVFTVAESSVHCANIPGLHCKNLFLYDGENNQFYLVVMPANKRLDIKHLQGKLGVKKLRFGNPEKLKELLGLDPGSVSPLGLINDTQNTVFLIVAKEVWDSEIVGFHPNINTATIEIQKEQFHKLIYSFNNERRILELE